MLSDLYTAELWILALAAVVLLIFLIITCARLVRLGKAAAGAASSSQHLNGSVQTLGIKKDLFTEAIQRPIRKVRTCAKVFSLFMAMRTGVHMMRHIAEDTFDRRSRSRRA